MITKIKPSSLNHKMPYRNLGAITRSLYYLQIHFFQIRHAQTWSLPVLSTRKCANKQVLYCNKLFQNIGY